MKWMWSVRFQVLVACPSLIRARIQPVFTGYSATHFAILSSFCALLNPINSTFPATTVLNWNCTELHSSSGLSIYPSTSPLAAPGVFSNECKYFDQLSDSLY